MIVGTDRYDSYALDVNHLLVDIQHSRQSPVPSPGHLQSPEIVGPEPSF